MDAITRTRTSSRVKAPRSIVRKSKRCFICKKRKPLTHKYFHYCSNTIDGFHSYCRPCACAQRRQRRETDPVARELDKARQRNALKLIRLAVFIHYGNKCACCGENEQKFFSLDHINKDGNAHRRALKLRGGSGTYRWIVKNNFPPIFQILCHNCNMAKASWKVCPHQQPIAA